jgi:alpha-tubulin suppressor-like RCC1 family protein
MIRNLLFCLGLALAAVVILMFSASSSRSSAIASTALLPAQQADAPVATFVAVSAGSGHTCGLTDRGGVMCWGSNTNGQLGDGTTTDRYTPVYVQGLRTGVMAISAGTTHTCALLTTGGLKCWGNNNHGQLGDGTKVNRWTPVDVIGLTSGVASIEAGGLDTCAVTIHGGAKCWGANQAGRLGDGTTTDRSTPANVIGLFTGVAAIRANDAGGAHTCALMVSGGLKCWGRNESGELGDGTTTESHVPIDVSGLTSGVSAVALGTWHTCAATSSGVKCWGDNSFGQLGNAMTTTQTTPASVVGLEGGALRVTTGGTHSCALVSRSNVKCWGSNFSGELGDGTTLGRLSPVDVIGLSGSVAGISAGGSHSCALLAGGGINCWGENSSGGLGNGDNSLPYSSIPVEVVRPTAWAVFLPMAIRPVPAFHVGFTAQPVSGFVPLQVNFTNTSTGPYSSLLWDFGDGVTSTLPNPTHVYWDGSLFTPVLYVSDDVSTETATLPIDVFMPQELIVNGGYETNDAWQFDGAPDVGGYTTTVAHGGQRSFKLGILPPDPIQYGYAIVSQQVTIPAPVSLARLSFWYWPRREDGAGPLTHSRQFVELLDGNGQLLERLMESSADAPDWQYAEFDVTKYAGQTVTVEFGVFHDGNALYGKRTAMFVDDVSLEVATAPWPVDGLAAYYPFSSNANDLSGRGNHGVVYGAMLTADRFGRANSAYHFNGGGDYIRVPYSNTLSFPHDLTVAAWIKTTGDAGGIAEEHNGGSDGNFVFGLAQDGRLRFGRSGAVASGQYDSDFVNDGQWHFVVGTYDSANQVVKVYIDGYFASSYAELQSLPDDHVPLIIGDENDHLYAFDGVIDDVRLYHRVLSEEEIRILKYADQ